MTELLPCPFCGYKTHWIEDIYEDEERRFYVFCNACGAMGAWKYTAKEAIEAWNTRWKPTCQWVDHGCTECDYEDYSRFDAPEHCPGCGREVVE